MQFIYAEGTCALSVHIMLEELGLPYEGIKVDLHDRDVLNSYNPRGYVPALILNDGTLLTEAISILQYLSSTHSDAYTPKSLEERGKCIEWLVFLSSEVHKGLAPFYARNIAGEKYLSFAAQKLEKRLQDMDNQLQDHAYLVGETYSIADMYALAVLRLIKDLHIPLDSYRGIQEYLQALEQNSVIKRTIEMEHSQEVVSSPRELHQHRDIGEEGIQPGL